MAPISERKQHDEQAETSRKQWFKDFFIKKPIPSSSEPAHSIAQPPSRKPDMSGGQISYNL
jgi:hypothetical protein